MKTPLPTSLRWAASLALAAIAVLSPAAFTKEPGPATRVERIRQWLVTQDSGIYRGERRYVKLIVRDPARDPTDPFSKKNVLLGPVHSTPTCLTISFLARYAEKHPADARIKGEIQSFVERLMKLAVTPLEDRDNPTLAFKGSPKAPEVSALGSTFCGLALLDAASALGNARHAEDARRVANFLRGMQRIGREGGSQGAMFSAAARGGIVDRLSLQGAYTARMSVVNLYAIALYDAVGRRYRQDARWNELVDEAVRFYKPGLDGGFDHFSPKVLARDRRVRVSKSDCLDDRFHLKPLKEAACALEDGTAGTDAVAYSIVALASIDRHRKYAESLFQKYRGIRLSTRAAAPPKDGKFIDPSICWSGLLYVSRGSVTMEGSYCDSVKLGLLLAVKTRFDPGEKSQTSDAIDRLGDDVFFAMLGPDLRAKSAVRKLPTKLSEAAGEELLMDDAGAAAGAEGTVYTIGPVALAQVGAAMLMRGAPAAAR